MVFLVTQPPLSRGLFDDDRCVKRLALDRLSQNFRRDSGFGPKSVKQHYDKILPSLIDSIRKGPQIYVLQPWVGENPRDPGDRQRQKRLPLLAI